MSKWQSITRASLNPLSRVALLRLLSTTLFSATLFSSGLQAADKQGKALQLLDHDDDRALYASQSLNANRSARVHPGTPLILAPVSGDFEFDLGGSDVPKLQLQLAHPLQLQPDLSARSLGPTDLMGLDATLSFPLGQNFALQGRTEQAVAPGLSQPNYQSQYQSLGSIQCLNGTLKPDSYTASGCRFVDDQSVAFDRSTLSLGAGAQFGAVSSSINWFTSQASSGQRGLNPANRFNQAPLLDPINFSETTLNRILPGLSPAATLDSEASGVDLNFQVGFTTDLAGEVQLGLALTRVYDANLNGLNGEIFTPLSWNDAAPFNAASLGIEFHRGSFSGGVRGFYREQIDFLDRQSLDSLGTFDVHFTWRAPWNANLSIGASNVLGAGTEEPNPADKPVSSDRFESIYGRIPYVRYQQDL
jgi:hypothetical protein